MEYLQYIALSYGLKQVVAVLNLIINGIPSIQLSEDLKAKWGQRFKPYYKWNTFNTNVKTAVVVFVNQF